MPVNKSGEKGIFLPEYFSATVFAHTFAAHLGRASPMLRITKQYCLIKKKGLDYDYNDYQFGRCCCQCSTGYQG